MALIDLTKTKKGRKESLNAPADAPESGGPETGTSHDDGEALATAGESAGKSAPGTRSAGSDDLAQLREIVFGPQLNELREDLARLENRSALDGTNLREEIQSLARRIDDRITELDGRTTKMVGDIGKELTAQSATLTRSIDDASRDTVELIDKRLQELREKTVDRAALSKVFLDLASEIDRGAEGSA